MKIGGKKIEHPPASEIMVFPREGEDIALKAVALLDRKDFEKLCPLPKVPQMRIKGNKLVDNYDDPRYAKALTRYNKNFMEYLIIAGLCAPAAKEGDPDIPIEWEKVQIGNRDTWYLWETELMESGFSDMERKRIHNMVASVNSLTESRLDEARNSFLQRQQEDNDELSSLTDEQSDTPSGEPASDSE